MCVCVCVYVCVLVCVRAFVRVSVRSRASKCILLQPIFSHTFIARPKSFSHARNDDRPHSKLNRLTCHITSKRRTDRQGNRLKDRQTFCCNLGQHIASNINSPQSHVHCLIVKQLALTLYYKNSNIRSRPMSGKLINPSHWLTDRELVD